MFVNTMPRYEILCEDAMDDPRPRLAANRLRAGRRVPAARGRRAVPRGRARRSRARTRSSSTPSSSSSRSPRRRASSTCRRATRRNSVHIGGDHMVFSGRVRAAVRARGRRAARRHDGRLRELREALAVVPPARLARRHDRRAQRHAARLAPPRHGLRAADAVGQAVHGLGDLRPRTRVDTIKMGEIVLRRRGGAADGAGLDLADQLQLAAALGRPDAERDGRVQPRQPGRHHDAVPADGRDVAGLDPGHARAADRRGAVGDRAVPARAARAARSCSARSSPTPT